MSPFIHHSRRSAVTLGKGGECGGGGTPLGLGLHPLLRPGGAEGGAGRQTAGEEDASAGLTCGDWTCSALSTLSITQIIRSEKRRGRGEAECMMGLMDGCVPGRVGALQYSVPTNVRSAARWRGAPATSASLASTWQVTGQSWVLLLPRPRWEHLPLAGMFPPFTQIGRRISQFSSLHVFIKFIL